MDNSFRSAAGLAAAALLAAACSSNGANYAHESSHHATAAEQLFGTTGGELAAAPAGPVLVVAQPVQVVPQPAQVVSSAPLTVPQTAAVIASSDAAFARAAAATNAAEIQLARIAYVRAESPDVRAFARQMLIDHRQMAINLDNFALERGYLVRWEIRPEKASEIERLSTLSGMSFDRAYMDEMVRAHEETVALLEAQVAGGRETAALASASLPTVRHHLEMARELDARL